MAWLTHDTPTARAGLAFLIEHPEQVLFATDFDGTIAPITSDPDQAYAHPEAAQTLGRLARRLGGVAIVTGRAVESALRLGGFQDAHGLSDLSILGQYGVERWDAATGDTTLPPPPEGAQSAREALPAFLAEQGVPEAFIEDKGRALGVHVRRLPHPQETFERLRAPMEEFARAHGLMVEPGKLTLELRAKGSDKGSTLKALLEEKELTGVAFAGDDLGDIAAFEQVDELRRSGRPGLLIYSHSGERNVLSERADVVVEGPTGMIAWLIAWAEQLET